MAHILVIEDEPHVCIALRDSLESENHLVTTASDGDEGFQMALRHAAAMKTRCAASAADALPPPKLAFDLIVLDLMLPRMSGLEICQRLRAEQVETPIIMLTARGAASDAAFGLKLGADDYISKPFDVGELLARVEAVLRRAHRQQLTTTAICIGETNLDLRRMRAVRHNREIELSPREFEILQLLIAHRGETVTREQLLHHIWGEHASLFTRTIDAHIARLRHKLEPLPAHPRYIITVHGLGYRLILET